MKKVLYIIIGVFLIVIISLLYTLINIKTEKVLYLDPSKICEIIMIDQNAHTAKIIDKKEDINNICNSFNHLKMRHIENDRDILTNIPYGGPSITFKFHKRNLLEVTVNYVAGHQIGYNGEAYAITDRSIADYWQLDYKLYNWISAHKSSRS